MLILLTLFKLKCYTIARIKMFPYFLQVLELFELIERSCDRADHRKTSIGKLTKSIRKKIKTFKAAFGMACENFSMEACSNSRSEHDVQKVKWSIQIKLNLYQLLTMF